LYSSKREVVKDLAAHLPGSGIAILLHALIVKAVHLGDLPRFMISPEQSYPVGPLHFVAKEQGQGLQAVPPPIYIVSLNK